MQAALRCAWDTVSSTSAQLTDGDPAISTFMRSEAIDASAKPISPDTLTDRRAQCDIGLRRWVVHRRRP